MRATLDRSTKRKKIESYERQRIETINEPCLSYVLRPASPGRGDAVKGIERKGKPLSTPAISRAGARRAPYAISKVRPDTEEILRLVLARIDDMKAEDTVSIDLRTKTAFADTMVVTSGRSQRHVGSIADRVLEPYTDIAIAVSKSTADTSTAAAVPPSGNPRNATPHPIQNFRPPSAVAPMDCFMTMFLSA